LGGLNAGALHQQDHKNGGQNKQVEPPQEEGVVHQRANVQYPQLDIEP